MATPIVLPKLGNTVESSIILEWHKSIGDDVLAGDILCKVETDKATVDVESPVSGTLLAQFFAEGDDVPVLSPIAVVGAANEAVDDLFPARASAATIEAGFQPTSNPTPLQQAAADVDKGGASFEFIGVSPRAAKLAQQRQIRLEMLVGSGPMGRIIERDVEAAIQRKPALTPLARAMVDSGGFVAPEVGSGARGKITKADLLPARVQLVPNAGDNSDTLEVIPLKGIRKTIARRMLESLQTTAQLTMSSPVRAQALLDMRQWLKTGPASLGLHSITINDLIMYAAVRTLVNFPDLNMLFEDETLYRYHSVHLGFAVDTPRGLVVPVIHNADQLNLIQLAERAHQLAEATLNQTIMPHELSGGTFTVSNLGSLGVEVFTPVLNPPQVGILGVGSILPRPVPTANGFDFVPHLTLSLTINHQVVDGSPGARFLKALGDNIGKIQEL